MSAALHKHWHRQDGKCFYCEGDTWMRGSGERRLAAKTRLGLPIGVDGAALALRRATATLEHLVRKADGAAREAQTSSWPAPDATSPGERRRSKTTRPP